MGDTAPLAELVSMMTSDDIQLHALFYRSRVSSQTIVIMIPGMTGSFFFPLDINPLAQSLTQSGYSFLAMNLRTAGLHGMLFANCEDYVKDVETAVQFAKGKGFSEIILLGHSVGSARVIYYLTQTKEPSVKGLILSGAITSPYLEARMRRNAEENARYEKFLAEQRAKVAAGRGTEVATYHWAPARGLTLSAATWVNIFGTLEESNASTVKFAKNIRVPVLIIHGAGEILALPPNAEQIYVALNSTRSEE